MKSFSAYSELGYSKPVRYRRGEGVNVWASKINDCAYRLDAMTDKLPPEAVDVLRELFEEIGQQARDASELT